MTHARAAEVLRGVPAFERSIKQAPLSQTAQACELGADALDFQEWLFAFGDRGYMRFVTLYESWPGTPAEGSFLDYARAEWEQEKGKG